VRPDELERRLRERLDALGPAHHAELLHVLMLPDFDRADRIGEFWGNPRTRTFAELLIDCACVRLLSARILTDETPYESPIRMNLCSPRTHLQSPLPSSVTSTSSLSGSGWLATQTDVSPSVQIGVAAKTNVIVLPSIS
jgi:hypothetical protein